MKHLAGCLVFAVGLLACGDSGSTPPHYVVSKTYFEGACEFVSTVDTFGDPVRLERCNAVAEVRNEGGDSSDPTLEELALIQVYDTVGLLEAENCNHLPQVPKLAHGESGIITCDFQVVLPTRINTSRPPVASIKNIAEEVAHSPGSSVTTPTD